MVVRNKVREIRLKKGEGLRETAAAVGMDPGQLTRVELGQRRCSDEKKLALAEHLNVPVGELFFVPSVDNEATSRAEAAAS